MSRGRKIAELSLVFAVVVASLFAGKAVGSLFLVAERGPYVAPEVPAPEVLIGRDAAGDPRPIELASRTRPMLVFVLAVECPFCRQNLPYWRELAAEIDAAGPDAPELLILSMSGAEETAAYLTENGLPSEFLVVSDEDIEPLEIAGVPATIVFPSSNAPMKRWIGVLNDTQLEILSSWARLATEKIAIP